MTEFSFQDMLKKSNINFAFIAKLEGGPANSAYVADEPGCNRGIIIATGFDLGAHNDQYLRKIGLNPTLRGKLYSYLGLQGKEAAAYLEQHPLQISDAEAQAIDLGNQANIVGTLIQRYEEDSQFVFYDLPEYWQTVIASVEFQHGSLRKNCPQFWQTVVRQHWKLALDELKDFGDNYPTRRNQEAKYILTAMSE